MPVRKSESNHEDDRPAARRRACVGEPKAAALADAISRIEETQQSRLARAMNGDPDGEGVRAFCVWLRRGAFEMVEDRENVDGKS